MFAAVYRWRLRPGAEEQFVDGWERVTRAIRQACGSHGSRLHRCADGTWLAYARWPDAATRDACEHDEQEGRRLMRDAVAEDFPEVVGEVVSDLLAEPGVVARPVGTVRSTRTEPVDDDWSSVTSSVEIDATQFGEDVLAGLDAFSHVEVVYVFDRVDPDGVETGARRPRGNPAWPEVGIFAQRAKGRPNRIGVTVCRLLAVEGMSLRVEGLDAIDGSPVLDVKPYLAEFGPRGPVHQPAWSSELMAGYW